MAVTVARNWVTGTIAASTVPGVGTGVAVGAGVAATVGAGVRVGVGVGDALPRAVDADGAAGASPPPNPSSVPASATATLSPSRPRTTSIGRRAVESRGIAGILPEAEERPVRAGGRGVGRCEVMADPTGFEPAISSVTGWHVGPLHHGSSCGEAGL